MQETRLVPREVLFDNPVKAAPRISPDGRRISYLAPSPEGVLNVWVRSLEGGDDEQVTDDRKRGIRSHGWTHDGRHLLYTQDLEGDENWHVFLVDTHTRRVRDLTPFQGARAQGVKTDRHHPYEMLVGLNIRDRSVSDAYRIDLRTGAVSLDTENPGDVLTWFTDAEFRIRGALAHNSETADNSLRIRDAPGEPWRDLCTWPFGENGGLVAFTRDGESLYAETSLGSDTTRLVLLDARSGEVLRELAHDPRCDVGRVVIHPETYTIEAVGFNYQKNEWRVLDPALEEHYAALAKLAPGQFSVTGRDHADQLWTVAYETDDGPAEWFIYDRETRRGKSLFVNRPDLEQYTLSSREPVLIKSRDGLEMVGYLTLPPGHTDEKLPLVLNVHGGPWARNRWGYDAEAQWFANRGYACLQLNFRGSTGFGKRFLNAGNGQWGVGTMQDDLSDAVRWAIERSIADPDRVCIYGGSYGGYAALAGLAFTPDLYCCGVDIVGPSNVKTLFESVPPYWTPLKKQLVLRVGDVEHDSELNQRISPLHHAGRIRAPLIIAQGANDPRVSIREADQMVEALRSRGLSVTYVVYPDEGHGFARPENRLDFFGRVEEFLAQHLGGRHEPWKHVEGSTAQLR